MFPTPLMFGYAKLLDRGDRLRTIRGRTSESRIRRTSPRDLA
ncbi:MAG TPA: hypothetical protein VLA69_09670 [Gaiellaceae bacterium]|nr:hypothetical protein [Gaiellaceae bacterium]